MVGEAKLERTESGLRPVGEGWFVVNGREARWRRREGRGHSLPLTGFTDAEAAAHFPQHIIVGAGDGPCAVLAVGAREHLGEDCNGGAYTVDDAAMRHGAGVEEETSDPEVAYARFAEPEPARYRDGWLPGG